MLNQNETAIYLHSDISVIGCSIVPTFLINIVAVINKNICNLKEI